MKNHKQIFLKTLILLIPLSLMVCLKGISQNQSTIDSLEQVLLTSKQDTNKVNAFNKLAHEYQRINLDTSLFYAEQALHLSSELSFKKAMANSYVNIGIAWYYKGSYDKAIEYYLKAIKLNEELGEKSGMLACYNNIGLIHHYQGDYDQAIEYYLDALKIAEELGNKRGIATCCNNIGLMQSYQGSYDKAMEYYLRALKIAEEIGDKQGLSYCFTGIAIVQLNQGSYDKAIEYYQQALKLFKELGDKEGLSYCYNGMGLVYSEQESYDSAMVYYFKSLKITEEFGGKNSMSLCYNNIGFVHKKQGSYDKAIEYYLKSLAIAEELGDKSEIAQIYDNIAALNIVLADSIASSKSQRLNYLNNAIEYGEKSIELAQEIEAIPKVNNAAKTLMTAYKKLGNFRKSTELAEVFISTQDSMFHEEKTKAIQEMETRYETEKKEAQILTLENENLEKGLDLEKRTNQRNIFMISGAAGIVVIFLLLLFYRHQAKKDRIIANHKIIQLEKEKKLLAARSIVNGQEQERKRIAKDLHDGLGVLLSTTKMYFTSIKDTSTDDKPLLDKVAKLLEQASGDVRKISHNMMPGLLTKFGLYEAVEDLIDQVNETTVINANCDIKGKTARLPENTEIMFYRIIQEMVNNTLKYAKAKNISLKFNISPREISFTYSDDGIGFDFEESLKSKTMGLNSIRSRVNFLSGTLQVDSKTNEGARYNIRVPL